MLEYAGKEFKNLFLHFVNNQRFVFGTYNTEKTVSLRDHLDSAIGKTLTKKGRLARYTYLNIYYYLASIEKHFPKNEWKKKKFILMSAIKKIHQL